MAPELQLLMAEARRAVDAVYDANIAARLLHTPAGDEGPIGYTEAAIVYDDRIYRVFGEERSPGNFARDRLIPTKKQRELITTLGLDQRLNDEAIFTFSSPPREWGYDQLVESGSYRRRDRLPPFVVRSLAKLIEPVAGSEPAPSPAAALDLIGHIFGMGLGDALADGSPLLLLLEALAGHSDQRPAADDLAPFSYARWEHPLLIIDDEGTREVGFIFTIATADCVDDCAFDVNINMAKAAAAFAQAFRGDAKAEFRATSEAKFGPCFVDYVAYVLTRSERTLCQYAEVKRAHDNLYRTTRASREAHDLLESFVKECEAKAEHRGDPRAETVADFLEQHLWVGEMASKRGAAHARMDRSFSKMKPLQKPAAS